MVRVDIGGIQSNTARRIALVLIVLILCPIASIVTALQIGFSEIWRAWYNCDFWMRYTSDMSGAAKTVKKVWAKPRT